MRTLVAALSTEAELLKRNLSKFVGGWEGTYPLRRSYVLLCHPFSIRRSY